jgi:hypothetical protein
MQDLIPPQCLYLATLASASSVSDREKVAFGQKHLETENMVLAAAAEDQRSVLNLSHGKVVKNKYLEKQRINRQRQFRTPSWGAWLLTYSTAVVQLSQYIFK